MPTKTSSASSHPGFAKRSPRELSIGGFDEHNENLHGVEFEAPFSAESQKPPLTKGRFSIDLSIELERQLERMEASSPPSSPPATAVAAVGTHGNMNANMLVGGDHSIPENQNVNNDENVALNGHLDKELLDPEILAHIITQLRQSLTEMTKERDELVKMLARVNAEEANVKDALQLMTEKATQAEEDLGEAKKRMKEDEEQIALLRAKVDESRRGLMRLQSESRRQSMSPIDIGRASSLTMANFGNPPSAKRTSFAPLTGSRHGRIPSPDNNLVSSDHTTAPNTSSSGDAGLSPNPPSSSRRFSGLFGRISPGIPDNESDVQPPPAEIETLKSEVRSLKSDLESAKHELAEATEAKEASETCVKALREFIAENNIGALAVELPPPPTMASRSQDTAEPKKTGSGWGFKLWGSGPGGSNTNSGPAAITGGVVDPQDAAAIPPPMSAAPSSGTYGVPPTPVTAVPTPTPPAPMPTPAPLSRKLTGLFSSRSSISSSRGSTSTQAKSQFGNNTSATGSPLIDRTNSTYSHSDVSSVVEPMGPVAANDEVAKSGEVVKPLGEDRVARESVTDLDLPSGLVGGIENGQETPSSCA